MRCYRQCKCHLGFQLPLWESENPVRRMRVYSPCRFSRSTMKSLQGNWLNTRINSKSLSPKRVEGSRRRTQAEQNVLHYEFWLPGFAIRGRIDSSGIVGI